MRQEFSYYYGNDYNDAYRINLPFNVSVGNNKYVNIQGIIDTGASAFTSTAYALGIQLSEQEFVNKYKLKPIARTGINSSAPVIYYRYIVDEIRLGKFNFRNFPVYITFNKRVTVTLVGMSFLRLINISIKPEYKTILFEANEELKTRWKNNQGFNNIDKVNIETFIDFGLEEDIGILEANRIYKLSSE